MKNISRLFIIVLVFLFSGLSDLPALENPVIGPEMGNLAPDFILKSLAGEPFKLSDTRGQVVLLNFWASWCPPCQEEVPSIEKVKRYFNPKDLLVATVSLDRSRSRLDNFLKEKKATFLVLNGSDEVSRLYGVRGIPTTLVLNKKGLVVLKEVGGVDWAAPERIKFFQKLIKEK